MPKIGERDRSFVPTFANAKDILEEHSLGGDDSHPQSRDGEFIESGLQFRAKGFGVNRRSLRKGDGDNTKKNERETKHQENSPKDAANGFSFCSETAASRREIGLSCKARSVSEGSGRLVDV
jgi:hypothetical protein